ncbi:hypothetical protein AB0B40_35990 [Streptomyces sp. NPDC042638]
MVTLRGGDDTQHRAGMLPTAACSALLIARAYHEAAQKAPTW